MFLRKKTFLFSDKCGKLNHGIAQNDLCVPYGFGQNFYYTLAERPLTPASKLMSGKNAAPRITRVIAESCRWHGRKDGTT